MMCGVVVGVGGGAGFQGVSVGVGGSQQASSAMIASLALPQASLLLVEEPPERLERAVQLLRVLVELLDCRPPLAAEPPGKLRDQRLPRKAIACAAGSVAYAGSTGIGRRVL